jgi:CDGSH-type Zn-finger protein
MFMEKPVVAGKEPIAVDVKKGETYYWCSCGRSGKQPFCDGSHQGTSFEPLAFTAEKDETVYLCTCKQTKNPPYCDGSHKNL